LCLRERTFKGRAGEEGGEGKLGEGKGMGSEEEGKVRGGEGRVGWGGSDPSNILA